MQIKRLKLTGFKSFVEPTELKIQPGLTGIVGPNGCGKSNLLEALRWVMGESSPKSVRGSGMEDVIFAGTESRPSREFAEVSLLAERDSQESSSSSNFNIVANDDDHELEVVRRIERGAGSAYRANGQDVRAKDVALIFADAATGAHSPALVSQGRISSIISAKPQERRQMLEEAAGISGLHVRRKDAEQKLRAAESNLEKLSIILGDMQSRANQLKRQARQAERYKKLSDEITQGEARLIFVKWRAAKAAADAAKALAATASAAVARASAEQAELSASQQSATEKLASDRAAAMAARDAASDLAGKIIAQTGERDRVAQRISDMERQAARIAEDSARENQLTHGAADALEQLKAEAEKLTEAVEANEAKAPTMERAAEKAEAALRENELQLARAHTQQAKADAETRVAKAALAQAEQRLARLQSEAGRLEDEQSKLGDEADLITAQKTAEDSKAGLEMRIAKAEAQIESHEEKRQSLLAARNIAQTALAEARAEFATFTSERDALERSIDNGSNDKAIDHIRAEKGFEHALAAALGDDANAAIGGEAGRRWSKQIAGELSNIGGDGDRLIDHVSAPDALKTRLSMVRVAARDDGQELAPGERLVTSDGLMRRWDGFIAEDDGAPQAEALIRGNRLRELTGLLSPAKASVSAAEASLENANTALTDLQGAREGSESMRQEADNELRQALREVDRAADALERLKNASASLQSRLSESAADIKTATGERDAANEALSALPNASEHDALVSRLENEGETLRQTLMRAQSELSAWSQKAAGERERRAVVQSEIRSWKDRAGEAEKRIAEMKKRSTEIAEEQSVLEDKPAAIAADLERLESDKTTLNEKLTAMQLAESESEAALRALESKLVAAAEALSSAREERAGAAARAENEEGRRIEMGRISGERFECPPPILPEQQGFAEDELDEPEAESARLEKLQASREAIGPVNLIAADELNDLIEEQARGVAESEELTGAINQLRGSIGSLNREGRTRLLEAFEAVDQHFRRLFNTLFNGGQAHLALIDSDDPLEAGLEIFAQPPGKKLQSLTLLSGGEQALTAVALIFALFLTNPAPICVLDEVDAPLDDANIERFCDLLDAMNRETDTRYLIVTHNAVTMSRMHRLFGVTMIEQGVSRLVSVDLGSAEELLAAE